MFITVHYLFIVGIGNSKSLYQYTTIKRRIIAEYKRL